MDYAMKILSMLRHILISNDIHRNVQSPDATLREGVERGGIMNLQMNLPSISTVLRHFNIKEVLVDALGGRPRRLRTELE